MRQQDERTEGRRRAAATGLGYALVAAFAFGAGAVWNGQRADELTFEEAVRYAQRGDPGAPATAAALMRVFAVTSTGTTALRALEQRRNELTPRAAVMCDVLRAKLRS